jgi:hypothetical protein
LGSGGSVDLVVMEKDQVWWSIDITDVLAYSDHASLFLSQSTTD